MNSKFLNHVEQILCPPGDGVFTVNTAKERKEKLQHSIYKNSTNIRDSWLKSIEEIKEETCLLGVCSDTGGGILRGANWGPLFVRDSLYSNNPDLLIKDLGDIRVIPHLLHDKYLNEKTIKNCQKALYNGDDYPVSPLSLTEYLCDLFYETYPDKKIFAIGGDHSVSYPLVKSYLKHKKKQGIKAAVIHFDAHTDLLTERLGIDLCFGSWCTHILDGLDSPNYLIQLGIRSSGKNKEHWEKTFGVQQYWSDEINTKGHQKIADQIKSFIKKEKIEEIYISFDIDAIDSKYASATGTPEPDGIDPYIAKLLIQNIASEVKVTGADMVEVAPFVKTETTMVHDSTLEVASSLSEQIIMELNK